MLSQAAERPVRAGSLNLEGEASEYRMIDQCSERLQHRLAAGDHDKGTWIEFGQPKDRSSEFVRSFVRSAFELSVAPEATQIAARQPNKDGWAACERSLSLDSIPKTVYFEAFRCNATSGDRILTMHENVSLLLGEHRCG